MKDKQVLLNEIVQLTSDIETNYPELYHFLDENPMTIPSEPHPAIGSETLETYLEDLRQLLKNHLSTHEAGSKRV